MPSPEFILTGGSAGGIGTFKNADLSESAWPVHKFRAMPQGGFGRPSADFAHFKVNATDPTLPTQVFGLARKYYAPRDGCGAEVPRE